MKRKSEFNKKLIMTVDEVLKETFGEAGLLVYTYLESQSVMREEIPERLETFSNCLNNFSAGGSVVEAMILRNLYSRFGLKFKEDCDGDSFTDQIDKLRNSLHH
ncbi:MAG: hypothetical protein ACETVP_01975 [Candidatus Bathyarchaeia archaeon]